MKYLLLLMCLSTICLNVHAQDLEDINKTTGNRYEVSIAYGLPFSLYRDFVLSDDPISVYNFKKNININAARNFGKWQTGIGYHSEFVSVNDDGINYSAYQTPYIFCNRIKAVKRFSYYAGIMLGYTWVHYDLNQKKTYNFGGVYSYNADFKGNGIVGGGQTGINFRVYKFIHINAEAALNMKEGDYTITETSLNTGEVTHLAKNSQTEADIIFRVGLRFKF